MSQPPTFKLIPLGELRHLTIASTAYVRAFADIFVDLNEKEDGCNLLDRARPRPRPRPGVADVTETKKRGDAISSTAYENRVLVSVSPYDIRKEYSGH